MCGEFGEVSGIIDLVINFLAPGTLFLNSYDTLSYMCVTKLIKDRALHGTTPSFLFVTDKQKEGVNWTK